MRGEIAATRTAAAWRDTGLTLAVWPALIALPVILGLVSIGLGRFGVPFAEVLQILLGNLLPIEPSWSGSQERVVELIRLPRIGLAAASGAALALAGAALQGAFRNPLVGPQIIGVSSGAAFGGALAILLGLGGVGLLLLANVFGLVAIVAVLALSRIDGRSPVLMLVLAGVVTGAFFSALVSLLTLIADPESELPAIVYWLMGSFATATYPKLGLMAVCLVLGGGLLLGLRFRLNILSLGDEEASALGIAVEPTRWLILAAVTLITAGSVAVAGVIGWIGLVVPHFARMLVGPDHRLLLPASALVGAGYTILIDDLARAATSSEIPLGILTAVVGAPVFALLLRRTGAGGWR